MILEMKTKSNISKKNYEFLWKEISNFCGIENNIK